MDRENWLIVGIYRMHRDNRGDVPMMESIHNSVRSANYPFNKFLSASGSSWSSL